MASFEEHCSDCKLELGEDFAEVHYWLDEFFPEVGPSHRDIRHHNAGVETVRKKWGDRAAKAAEIHIRKDCKGNIPNVGDQNFVLRVIMNGKVASYFESEGYRLS